MRRKLFVGIYARLQLLDFFFFCRKRLYPVPLRCVPPHFFVVFGFPQEFIKAPHNHPIRHTVFGRSIRE